MEDDPDGNLAHIAEHGITQDDVDQVLNEPERELLGDSSGRPIAFGYGLGGDYIAVVYEVVDEDNLYPVTAFKVEG